MPTLIATGFGPWGEHKQNASWEGLSQLETTLPDGWALEKHQIPVSWYQAQTCLDKLLSQKPDAFIAFGQCPDPYIRLERLARNGSATDKEDIDGNTWPTSYIEPDGADSYPTTLPIQEIESELKAAEIPNKPSDSAGDYLCNHLFYLLMERVKMDGREIPAGFIHVPELDKMDLSVLVEAICIIILATTTFD